MNNEKLLKKLEYVTKQRNELIRALERVEYALSPDSVFDFWDQNIDKNAIHSAIDIQGEALIRCNKALEEIKAYKNKTFDSIKKTQ